jgi:uncharacterized protein YjgD (DUF1641 family)
MTTTTTAGISIESRLDALSEQIAFLTREAEEQRAQRQRWQELTAEATPVLTEVMERLGVVLDGMQRRGYLSFAMAGVGVADEVVTHYTEEDVRRLGENVVLILDLVKDLTQPEILAVVRRMIDAVERQRVAIADEPADPPTLWQLARRARDPEVRRGLGRALDTLRAVAEADTAENEGSGHEAINEEEGGS